MRKRPSLSAYVIQLKGLLFSYYWLAVLISSTGILILFTAERISEQLCGAALGGVLAFCYFIQKQKLDDAAFFKQLFTEFNKRYDELNDDLAVVLDTKAVGANAAKLVDYFNLDCGQFSCKAFTYRLEVGRGMVCKAFTRFRIIVKQWWLAMGCKQWLRCCTILSHF